MLPKSSFDPTLATSRQSSTGRSSELFLSREEETELIRRVQLCNDRNAADVLVRAHWGYVSRYALRYHRYGAALDDLIAEGHVGVVHALERFDSTRGVRFVTYAKHWVRAFMLQHVLANWSIVSGGSRVLRTRWFFRLRRERARVVSVLGEGEAADAELAGRLGVRPEKVRQMIARLDVRDVSLDAKLVQDSPMRMLDQLPAADNQERTLFELRLRESLKSVVQHALTELDARERYIVERRMMAEASEAMSLTAIGRNFGVSRERARQLEVRARRKLRARVIAFGDPWVDEFLRGENAGRHVSAHSKV
jgi:RNA polymerase sigma-32 factor